MKHNSSEVTDIATLFLKKKNINYRSLSKPVFEENFRLENGQLLDIWVVPYEYKVFQDEAAYVHIDDASGKVLYILTKHGYIE